MFQQRNIHGAVEFINADDPREITDGLRRVTAPAHCRYGGHSRVVPAADKTFADKLLKLALAHNRIGKIKSCKFNLPGVMYPELFEKPVV